METTSIIASTSEATVSDVVVVGGGHNALVCAAYLAEAGLTVTVLEGSDVIGGNTVTEELTLPGWANDSCSSAHVVLQSNPLIRDDELGLSSRYGLEYIITDPAVVIPLAGEDAILIHSDLDATVAEFARRSPSDALALRAMIAEWTDRLRTPHRYYSAGLPLPGTSASRVYRQLRQRTAWDVIMSTFAEPAVRQAMVWMAFATIQSPDRPGTGALPAAIISGRISWGWTTPVGGSGALPTALAAHIADHAGSVLTSARVDRLTVEGGRCVGARTHDGRAFRARRAVVAGSHIKELTGLLGGASPMAREAAALWQPGLALFAVHCALRADVRYRTPGGPIKSVAGGLGTPEGLRRQIKATREGRIETEDPWLLMVSSTVVDPGRAPGGVFKLLTIAPGSIYSDPWTERAAESYALRLLDLARNHVDGLEPENILFMRAESPTALAARNLSNIGGSCHGGEFLQGDGSTIPGWPNYRTDIGGLYLTGSTTHPGGSVSGWPGRNTARIVLSDLGFDPGMIMSMP